MGEGRLTDAIGRTVDFTSAVIILTSNLGTAEAVRTLGFGAAGEAQAEIAKKAVREFFRPEFVNRLDRVVCFRRLAEEDIRRIALLQIARLVQRDGLVRRTTVIDVSPRALDRIVRLGYDPDYGGRALKRALEKELTGLAAERLVAVPPDRPVIFEIHEVAGRLAPRILDLEIAPRVTEIVRPDPVADRDGLREAQERMLGTVEELLESVGPGGRDTAVLVYRDRLRQLRAQLRESVADLRERDVRAPFPNPVKAAPKWKQMTDFSYISREAFSRLDIRDYFEEVYRRSSAVLSPEQLRILPQWIATETLRFQLGVLRERPRAPVCLHIRPLVAGQGRAAVQDLRSAYLNLAAVFDPSIGKFDGEESHFVATVPGLAEFLQPESGIHLFVESYGARVPIQVRVLRVAGDPAEFVRRDLAARARWLEAFERGEAASEDDPWRPGPVVRIYCLGDEGSITDLRTGLMDRYFLAGPSWFLWAYNALPRTP
jgi:ATP-dependent Clp protease ATP-binding subunit ClpC